MFDFHAHIGDITSDAIVCTSKAEEYSQVKNYSHRAYGVLNPESENISILIDEIEHDKGAIIGEFGLDKRFDSPFQLEVFRTLLALVKELKRPFVLHYVKTRDTILKELKSFAPLPPFIIHNFTGSKESALDFIKLGGYISLSPRIYKTKHLNEVIKLPFLLETDMATGDEQRSTLSFHYERISAMLGIKSETLEERQNGRITVFTP